jgi:alanyl-tRNA synthetase
MVAKEIRRRFLDFFQARGHEIVPSSSLVPSEDPTLLFTNAGMVQFKKVFLGAEHRGYDRAVTSQKCVRAGGKHNDLEEVGRTARHHTFFEMLGNFSFGDYFKREAIEYAWGFLVDDLGLDPDRMYASVHHTDDEAHGLWQEVVGLPPSRIYRLGDKDNFWQMADTGPCGPCSELHYDMRPSSERGGLLSVDEFMEAGERGEFLELWNLVFMQFDRDQDGVLHPLPAPSIDTGAGLERIASVMQEVSSNYGTDLFLPLIRRVEEVVGRPYHLDREDGTSFRVLADHGRAVAFLLADGVFPSNEGRGYVVRRILRRAVRHGWILGRREPTLVEVVDAVTEGMGDVFPELLIRKDHLLNTTRAEEERFLDTIEGGMTRFNHIAPMVPEGAPEEDDAAEVPEARLIPGEEAFRLYDTFGFPLDLTQLMARERGYEIDVEGFETALDSQRERSRADRAQTDVSLDENEAREGWVILSEEAQEFVGYDRGEIETEVLALRPDEHWPSLLLRENPFYLESGGQVSDVGVVEGEGWALRVEDIRPFDGKSVVLGPLERGALPDGPSAPIPVLARVTRTLRHDTERNHTATHLLHAALRGVLGDHVVQRGSLVAPDRLRFDFAHTAPLTTEEVAEVEKRVNEGIWADHPVETASVSYTDAVARGAMALFGEKYGDEVRVVEVPGVSLELCGGTHCRHTGEIGLFRIVSETGIAAGIRRIEAVTGPGAFQYFKGLEDRLNDLAEALKARPESAYGRLLQVLREKEELEGLLDELRRSGGGGEVVVAQGEVDGPSGPLEYQGLRLRAKDPEDARVWGDGFRSAGPRRVAVVAADLPEEKHALFAFVSDDLIVEGIRADVIVRTVAERVGGKGGGRPHMAQAGVADPASLDDALQALPEILRAVVEEEK